MLSVGTVLDGKYEIRGRLGGGGMGEIYLALRVHLGDQVAVKVIRAAGPDPAVWRERFLRESRACAQLRHPHIVAILDFSIAEGQPYLVMEYLNGPSLAELLRARGTFDLSSVQGLLADIGSAIHLAHCAGIVHRDLKPQNVVSHRYDSGEAVYKVIDFGLANIRGPQDETRLTQAHEFIGTVAYAAPEQFEGSAPDPRTDQYSLAIIIYELLAGVRPIQGDGFLVIVERHLNAQPVPLDQHRPDLPPHVTAAVMRALAKSPDARWPSVMDFVRAMSGDDVTVAGRVTAPPASALLSTYELGPVIGPGRLGSEIHAGSHRALGHPVAIRTFRHAGRADREAVRARFLSEARTLQVSHPNVIQVRDFGEDADCLYVVTDLLAGCSLAELLEDTQALPIERVQAFVAQILDATAALNKRGGLICGLHPDIIRVVREDGEERVAISSAGVRQIQDVLATLGADALRAQATDETELLYVAPELLTGQTATARSDVYTVGVLGYQMATGRTPYGARTLPALIGAVLQGPPPDPRTLREELPARQAAVLMRALARDPEARFDSVREMLAAWTDE
jgi:serine/threonine protein kinase